MYSIESIKKINADAVKHRAARCSYSRDAKGNLVIHSAKKNVTKFLGLRQAKAFLASWLGTNSATKRDQLVESYF